MPAELKNLETTTTEYGVQGDHSPDNVKCPDGSRRSAC